MDSDRHTAGGAPREVYRFGDLSLDVAQGSLRRPDGVEIALRPKTSEVLRHLAQRAGQVVSREELMEAVWPGVFVTDDSITQCVGEIRRALGGEAHLLRTLPKRGYLLAAEPARREAISVPPAVLSAFDQAGAALSSSEPTASPEPERRQLTLLFCGLAGGVSAQLDLEDLHAIMASYESAVRAVVEQHDGVIVGYPGEWISVCFGWPVAQENDAERAVRAALAVVKQVAAVPVMKLPGPLRARIGIATGQAVMLGRSVAGASSEGRVVGQVPSLAAALQASAGPDCVLIDAATYELAGRLFDSSVIGEVVPNGLSMPGAAFLVRGERQIESRFKALRGEQARLRLIGREDELELLQRRWRRALSGDAQIVLVSGEAGIGKSRLLAALQGSLHGKRMSLRFSCSPHHQASALSPVIHQLRRAAGFAQADTPEDLRHKLRSVLPVERIGEQDFGLIAGLLAVPEISGVPMPDLSPQRRKEKTAEALVRIVATYSRVRPVLMTVEDVHWADPSTRDLLDLAIERLQQTRCLLAVTFRPEFVAPWLGRAGVSLVSLSRLPPAQAAELAVEVAGRKMLPRGMAEQIAARTDGVPLFVEELTKVLLEGQGTASAAGLTIPSTLRASLAARLDRLPQAREVVQLGAAIGRSFPHDLVADISGVTMPTLCNVLDQVVASGLVSRRGEPPNAVYTFKHALVHEAAYDTLLRSRRREIHRRIAYSLQERFPETVEREPEMLARHAALAGETEKAARLLLRAGENAMRAYALQEAEAHLTAGLDLVASLPDSRSRQMLELDLQTTLGQTLMGARGFADPATGVALDRARVLATGTVAVEKLVSILHGRLMFHLVGGRIPLALDAAEQIVEVAEQSGSPPLLLMGQLLIGMPKFHAGQFVAALDHWRLAPSGQPSEAVGLRFVSDFQALLLAYRAWALLMTGDVEAADRLDDAAWTAAVASHATFSNAGVFCFSCLFSVLRGDQDAVRRKIGPTLAYCGEQRYSYWLAVAMMLRSYCMAEDDGASASSMEIYRRAVEAYRATGSSVMISAALGYEADLLRRAGRETEAMPLLTEALDLTRGNQDRWFEAELHRIGGHVWRAKGDEGRADACFQQAILLAQSQGATLWELRAARSRALLLLDQGRRLDALSILVAARVKILGAPRINDVQTVDALLATLKLDHG